MSEGVGRVVGLYALVAFAAAASLRSIDALLVPIAAEFSVTPGAAAIASSAFLAAYGLLQVAHGPMAERTGKIPLTVAHLALGGLAMFASAIAPTLEWLAAARLVAGASAGSLITLALAWIGDAVPWQRRQTVLARFMIGQLVGIGAGAAGAGLIAERFGWREVLVALGVIYLVAGLALHAEARRNPAARECPAGRGRGLAVTLRRFAADVANLVPLAAQPGVRWVLAAVFVEGLLLFGAVGWMPLHVHDTLGLGVGASGALVIVFALGGLVYSLAAGRLVPRLGDRGIVRLGGVAMVTGLALVSLASSVAIAAAGLALVGIGLYAFHNVMQAHGTQMAPQARGSALSLFALSLFGSQSLGVWAGSRVVDATGTAPLLAGAAAGLAVLCVAVDRRLARLAPPA